MMKKILILLCIFALVLNCLPVSAQESELILSPADGTVLTEKPLTFSASGEGFTNYIFELDGIKLGEVGAEGSIAAPDSLDYGKHKLVCIAIKADGTAVKKTSNFVFESKIILKTVSEDFNGYDGTLGSVGFKTSNDTLLSVKPASECLGASGDEGDLSLGFGVNTNDAGKQTEVLPNVSYNFNSGITEIEFDVKLNKLTDRVYLEGPYLWFNGNPDLTDYKNGYWNKTTVPLEEGWTRLKLTIDMYKNRVSLEIDGTVVLDEIDADNGAANQDGLGEVTNAEGKYRDQNNKVSFWVRQDNAVESAADRSAVWIDNYSFNHIHKYSGIDKVAYISDGIEYEKECIPVDAEEIKVYLKDGLKAEEFSADGVTVTKSNGEAVELSSASYNSAEKTIICVPKLQLPSDENLTVTLLPTLKFDTGIALEGRYSAYFKTGNPKVEATPDIKVSGSALMSGLQLKQGSIISCGGTVKNISSGEAKVLYILTVRKDNRLIAMKPQSMTLAAGASGTLNLTLPALTENGNYEVYLMNCTDYENRKAISKFIKIN